MPVGGDVYAQGQSTSLCKRRHRKAAWDSPRWAARRFLEWQLAGGRIAVGEKIS
jgi:hypothetical protein